MFGAHVASGATLWPRRLKSLLGMGVATFRLVAALLTILGVWINLDTFFYLRSKPQMDVQNRARMIKYQPRPPGRPPGQKYPGYVTMEETTGTVSLSDRALRASARAHIHATRADARPRAPIR